MMSDDELRMMVQTSENAEKIRAIEELTRRKIEVNKMNNDK